MQLEKPMLLANLILPNKIDKKFLEACLKQQEPVSVNIYNPTPVIVTYQTVDMDSTHHVHFLKDVYNLL